MVWLPLAVYLMGVIAFPWIYGKLEKHGLMLDGELTPKMVLVGALFWPVILPLDLVAGACNRLSELRYKTPLYTIYKRAKA